MNNTPTLVVSTTLDTVEWQNSTRLFEDVSAQIPLKLVDSQTFSTSVLSLTYEPTEQ